MPRHGHDVRPPGAGGGEQHDRAGFEQPIDFGQGKVGFFIGDQKMPLLTELKKMMKRFSKNISRLWR